MKVEETRATATGVGIGGFVFSVGSRLLEICNHQAQRSKEKLKCRRGKHNQKSQEN